jgi:hypothetical protein
MTDMTVATATGQCRAGRREPVNLSGHGGRRTSALPFARWMLVGWAGAVPVELEEAAAIDGAGRLRALVSVTAPLLAPSIVDTALVAFIAAWTCTPLAAHLRSAPAQSVRRYGTSFAVLRPPGGGEANLVAATRSVVVSFRRSRTLLRDGDGSFTCSR